MNGLPQIVAIVIVTTGTHAKEIDKGHNDFSRPIDPCICTVRIPQITPLRLSKCQHDGNETQFAQELVGTIWIGEQRC